MKQLNAPKSIAPFEFEGAEIRRTVEGQMVAVDVLAALRVKSPRSAWRNLKKEYGKEFCAQVGTYSFGGRGRPTEVVSPAIARKIGMVAKGEYGEKWRNFLNGLYEFVEKGGEDVANYGIDTENSPEALKRLETRARTKLSNKQLNGTIQKHGGGCYALVADLNNVAVTGKRAHEIKKLENVKHTRDGLSTAELSLIAAAEELETVGIVTRSANGDGAILDVCSDVTEDIRALRRKWLGDRSIPNGDGEAVPMLQVTS